MEVVCSGKLLQFSWAWTHTLVYLIKNLIFCLPQVLWLSQEQALVKTATHARKAGSLTQPLCMYVRLIGPSRQRKPYKSRRRWTDGHTGKAGSHTTRIPLDQFCGMPWSAYMPILLRSFAVLVLTTPGCSLLQGNLPGLLKVPVQWYILSGEWPKGKKTSAPQNPLLLPLLLYISPISTWKGDFCAKNTMVCV